MTQSLYVEKIMLGIAISPAILNDEIRGEISHNRNQKVQKIRTYFTFFDFFNVGWMVKQSSTKEVENYLFIFIYMPLKILIK